MGWAIKYNPNGVIPNQVTDYLQNIDEPLYMGRENTLVNCSLSQVGSEQDFTKWKVSSGTVVLMNMRERYLLDTAGQSDIKTLTVNDWKGTVERKATVVASGVTKFISGKVSFYTEKSTVDQEFHLTPGRIQTFSIDGAFVTLALSRSGSLTIKKSVHTKTIQAVIHYKEI